MVMRGKSEALGHGEGAGVQGVGELGVALAEDSGARAGGLLQFDQLNAELIGYGEGCGEELGAGPL